jgi:hypothetical protein
MMKTKSFRCTTLFCDSCLTLEFRLAATCIYIPVGSNRKSFILSDLGTSLSIKNPQGESLEECKNVSYTWMTNAVTFNIQMIDFLWPLDGAVSKLWGTWVQSACLNPPFFAHSCCSELQYVGRWVKFGGLYESLWCHSCRSWGTGLISEWVVYG